MAKNNESLTPNQVEDDVQYTVVLKKPIKHGRMWVRPGGSPVLKGKVIKEHSDAIERISGVAG